VLTTVVTAVEGGVSTLTPARRWTRRRLSYSAATHRARVGH
jgi:hypothetical protein